MNDILDSDIERLADPVELWYIPHWMIAPARSHDKSVFISNYECKPGAELVSDLQPVSISIGAPAEDRRHPQVSFTVKPIRCVQQGRQLVAFDRAPAP